MVYSNATYILSLLKTLPHSRNFFSVHEEDIYEMFFKFQERFSSLTCFLQPNDTFIDQKSWTMYWPDSITKLGLKKDRKTVKTSGNYS